MQYLDYTSRRRDELMRLLFRVRLIGPTAVLATLVILFAVYDPHGWRLWVLLGALAVCLPAFVFYFVRYRERPISMSTMVPNVSLMLLLAMAVFSVTGGIESPLIIGAFVLVTLTGQLVRRLFAFAIASSTALCVGALFWGEWAGWIPHSTVELYGLGDGFYRNGTYVLLKWIFVAAGLHGVTLLTTTFANMYRESGAELERAREELLRAYEDRIRSLESIGAQIAHEVRNPLSSIRGLTQVLRRDAAGDAARHLEVMAGEVDRLNGVLDEYLAFARPTQPSNIEAVDLPRVLDDLLVAFAPRLQTVGARLARQIDPATPRARGDARKLAQAFFNVIQNAVESMDGRGGTLSLSIAGRDGGVEAIVGDTGPGIARDVQERLFTPFVTTKARGTGLGLVVAKSAVVASGGKIALHSEPGAGTLVSVWLPKWSQS